jgi:hypothetical protein
MAKQEQHRITGIVRNLPASVVEDFSCAELVNMRNKDGVWRPVGEKKGVLLPDGISGSSKFFLHTTGTTQQMIGYKNGYVLYFDYPNGTVATTILTLLEPSSSSDAKWKVRFSAVGSILVIFVEPTDGKPPYTKYAVWKADEANIMKYILLPELDPPRLEIGLYPERIENGGAVGKALMIAAYETNSGDYIKFCAPMLFDFGSNAKIPYLVYSSIEDFIPKGWKDIIVNLAIFISPPTESITVTNFSSYINSETFNFYRIFNLSSIDGYQLPFASGTLSGSVFEHDDFNGWLSVTHRFGNGAKISVNDKSDTEYIIFSESTDNDYIFEKNNNAICILSYDIMGSVILESEQADGQTKAESFVPTSFQVYLTYPNGSQKTIFSEDYDGDGSPVKKWQRNFSANGSIEISSAGNYNIGFTVNGRVLSPFVPGKVFVQANINKSPISYIAKSAPGKIYSMLKIPEKDTLSTFPTAPIQNNNDYFGNCDLVYNSQLFLGDTSAILFKGYTYADYYGGIQSGDLCVYFATYLYTDSGDKTVIAWNRTNLGFNVYGSYYILMLPTLLSYPSERAYRIDIFVAKSSKPNDVCLIKSFNLTQSKRMGFSYYYVFAFDTGINISTLSPTIRSHGITEKNSIQVYESTLSENTQSLPDVNGYIKTANNVLVTAVHLPMVFPNKQNYPVGNGSVIGFSANNLSIDAANFGMFPVFAFTEGGVYAMELGTDGGTLVQRIVPMSGDVCISRDSITNIGGATLFASKDGLRILRGQRSEKITAPLEFYGGNPLDEKYLTAIMGKYGLQGYVSSETDFQTFLSGAKCYFHYKENEVVITNEAYPYSYVYSLNTKMYHKIYERYINVFNDYPNAYGVANYKTGGITFGQGIFNLGEEVAAPGSRRNVLVQTNAFKLTTDGFEMIRRIFTRFGWSAAPAGSKIGIYLFVSNDTRKWAQVDGCVITQDKAPNGAQNFAPLRCPASVKYGMLVIAGDMDMVNDYLTHISVEYEQRYKDKLR